MSDIYKPVDWSIQQLVDAVLAGTLTLPDLQRPFVWHPSKVRDLMDSLYRGYPVGELMFWNRPSDGDRGAIGVAAKAQDSKQQIVDGQQRITSLFVMLTGQTVIDDDYRTKSIRVSFNPFTERFEVAQPAFDRSPEWVSDISTVFRSALTAFDGYVARLEAARGSKLTEAQRAKIHGSLTRLEALKTIIFKVIELQAVVEKPVVADIFVRINSEGVNLTSADFILTWLSVFWEEGRDELEVFARNSRLSADRISEINEKRTDWSPKNHFIAPRPKDLVRLTVAVGQNRGRLSDAYNALRALDRKTGMVDPARQSEELDKLKGATPLVLYPLYWDELSRVLVKGGFRSKKMVTSSSTIVYTYALWILGRNKYKVELATLRDLMARWFFMSQMTQRYTSSPETRIQQDLDRLDGAVTAADFVLILEGVIATILTTDYWAIRLPEEFVSSSTSASPAYQAYLASLNILEADLFALNEKVRDWTDPTNTTLKNVEGHHLFPKAYLLEKLGYSDLKKINQVANFAPTDWNTNNIIDDRPPSEYWPELISARAIEGVVLAKQMKWHALPENWTAMGYEEFLAARRKMMAQVVRDAYFRLLDPSYQPELNISTPSDGEESVPPRLIDLIANGLIFPGDLITSLDLEKPNIGEISEDGEILLNEKIYDSPEQAARAMGDEVTDGWDYWALMKDDFSIPLRDLVRKAQSL